ncbi:MAG: hypothetical protein M0Z79_03255 [Nitrospiraceae bacterium]|nr:hypothetical protein [Nitrospiraceae bacterium]
MPHFGLMNTEDSFKTPVGALQRSRLHIRAGRRRLRQGKISSGILTLYDALLFAMEWHIKAPETKAAIRAEVGEDLRNDHVLYRVLVRSGVIDGRFDYEAFDRLVEKASEEEMPDYDYSELLTGIESVMTQLGVMPFDEAALPPEDPTTF